MQTFFLFLSVFFVKIEPSVLTTQNTHIPFYLTNVPLQCSPNDYCLTQDSDRSLRHFFSTKTTYQVDAYDQISEFKVDGCEPSAIWLLIRHGTRLPTARAIKRFGKMEKVTQSVAPILNFRDEIVDNLKTQHLEPFCKEDFDMFQQWKWNNSITADQALYLVEQGYKELANIAHNFRTYLPTLFEPPYDETKFHFRHTNTERTRSSFRAFVNELFGENAHEHIAAELPPSRPDYLLKAYANCGLWQDQKKQLKQPSSEVQKFENTSLFKQVIADVDSRFGFNGTLSMKRLKDIYDLCQYEQAWKTDKTSVWCALFTPSQLQIEEYREDLNYFYKSSHGSKLNKHIKCFAMKDMLKRLSNESSPKTTVYFSHSASVQLFLTSLGALKDEIDLKADNFAKMSARKWRTSKIAPFAANVAVVRYKCPTNDRAKFFLNERSLHFDWCTDGVCDWHDVQQKYAFYARRDCNEFFCRKML